MAEVRPFRGIRYNSAKVEAGAVVAPPYDIISPEMKAFLYEKSPYNIVRVDAGAEFPSDNEKDNKYTRAAALLDSWMAGGIIQPDKKPCFYLYQVDYVHGGQKKRLRGFFGLLKLEPLGSGVYPHEATHSVARVDRLNLLRATGANTSPIFSVYNNPEGRAGQVYERIAANGPPEMEAADQDCGVHRLWVIDDPADIASIQADLEGRPVFIADGHHRYETALENRRLMRQELGEANVTGEEPFNYVLMFLANVADGGLTILPAHRLVKTESDVPMIIEKCFALEKLPREAAITESIKGMKNTFGLFTGGEKYRASYRGDCGDLPEVHPVLRRLDVVILQELVINRIIHAESIAYEMDPLAAEEAVRAGRFKAAFFLNPTGIEDVMEVALSGNRMPPKSTYFYPKLMTGFVMSRF